MLRLGLDGTMRDDAGASRLNREVDLEAELWGPVLEPLHEDPQLFREVRVDEARAVKPATPHDYLTQ